MSPQDLENKKRHDTFYEHLRTDFTQESIDMIRFIDWNERRHQIDAQKYLNKNSHIARQSLTSEPILQHRLTEEITMKEINAKLAIERQFN